MTKLGVLIVCVAAASSLAPLAFVPCALAAQSPRYDLIITGGTVIDGTGAARFRADVAIIGDRIALVSRTPLVTSDARRTIDARGLIVAPGFIDMHAHLEPILQMPDAQSAVRQGVTLALGGPDGGGPFPFGAYADSVAARPLGMNVAFLAGHNTIRRRVMGTANRAPTAAELTQMRTMVAESMRDGAFGMSTGLRYIPGYYSKTDEVIALSAVAADSGGIYTSHLREEGVGLIGGVAEALEIGRRARIPIVLTHHKAVGQLMWGKSAVTLAMIDSARKAGTDVMADQYPYTASSTSLDVLVPPWALEGGNTGLRARLAEAKLKDSITRGVIELLLTDRGGGDLRRVQFARVAWDSTLNGKTLHDLVLRKGVAATIENAAPTVLESVLKGSPSMIYHIIDEGDVKRIMAHPQTMIASDGRLTRIGDGVPHPRNYGTFPRVLGHYVRDERVLTLEQAVHKMTGMPAARLGLRDRGCLHDGCAADVAIFDAATVRDAGTFADPHHYAEGIPYVIVNGVPVVDRGAFTSARPGRVLRRVPGKARAQARPDFSGRWTSAPEAPPAADAGRGAGRGAGGGRGTAGRGGRAGDMGSGWGSNITISQAASVFTVEYVFFGRGDLQPPLRFVYNLDGAETKNTVMMGRGIQEQRSKTAWRGDTLAITTMHAFENPETHATENVTVVQSLVRTAPDSLVVVTTRAGVLGGPTTQTRTVYRKTS